MTPTTPKKTVRMSDAHSFGQDVKHVAHTPAQTPATTQTQKSVQYHKTTITHDAQTTKHTQTLCDANTNYTIPTRTSEAETQHMPTTQQTPIIEVNKHTILEATPVQKALTTTETSIHITPNVETNTAYTQQPSTAQTQTTPDNLVQRTTHFHKPTTTTTIDERTTTKHIPSMCHANTHYTATRRTTEATTLHKFTTKHIPLVEVNRQQTQPTMPIITKIHANTETTIHTVPQIQTNTEYISMKEQTMTQTPASNLVQATTQFRKPTPTTSTEDAQTTKNAHIMCHANTSYTITKTKLKHQYTHTTTRTVDAATQHVPTIQQTPIIEVNKHTILEATPVQKTLTTTETSIHVTPNVDTNTAYTQQATTAQTQTTQDNLVQRTTHFCKPTIATSTDEQITTKHSTSMCDAEAAYIKPLKVKVSAATQHLAPVQQTPLVEIQKEPIVQAAPPTILKQQIETTTHTTPQIITDSALTTKTSTAQAQTITTSLVQQSVQFRKHAPDTQETHTSKTNLIICNAASHSVSSVPQLKHRHAGIPQCTVDSYVQTCQPESTRIIEAYIQYDPETPSITCDASCVFVQDVANIKHQVCSTGLTVTSTLNVGDPPQSTVVEPNEYVSESSPFISDSYTQVEAQPLEFYLTELITQTSGRYISSNDLAKILSDFGFFLESTRFSQTQCESASFYFSPVVSQDEISLEKTDLPRVKATVCHVQTACDVSVKGNREVGTMFDLFDVQQAEVGIQVDIIPADTFILSPTEAYTQNYRLGRIAETSVSVMATTATKSCQITDWRSNDNEVCIPTEQSTQTDWWVEELSEATTKLVYEQTKHEHELTEDSSFIIEIQSEQAQEEMPSDSYTDYESGQTVEVESVLCQVRERTVQYQLVEGYRKDEFLWSNHIQEVASPRTGCPTPVGTAVRSGWLRPTDTEIYIDPGTNVPMRLETAHAGGLVTLNARDESYEVQEESGRRCLLLIERISYTWRPVRIVSFIDTLKQVELSIQEARLLGFIDISSGEPIILDRETNMWISPEEAAGRGIIELEAVDSTEDSEEVAEGTYTVRVFRITAVRPGGEPSDWLDPEEAASLGLFNWNTGEVAAEWAARPDFPTYDSYSQSDNTGYYKPTKWCSLLTARKAGWLRLQAEAQPSEWTIPQFETDSDYTPVVLATYDHLVVPNGQTLSPPVVSHDVEYNQTNYRTEHIVDRDEIDYIEYRRRSSRSTIRKRTDESQRTRSDAYLSTITSHSLYHKYDAQIFSGQNTRRRYLSEQYLREVHVPHLVDDIQDWDFEENEQEI